MVSSNASALGVIFANTYDNLVPELVAERTLTMFRLLSAEIIIP